MAEYYLVSVHRSSVPSPRLTISEVACRCGVHPELIERFMHLGLIDSAARDDANRALFNDDVIPLVRKILRLRNQLGVNYAGVGVVLELLARIELLEGYVKDLERKLME